MSQVQAFIDDLLKDHAVKSCHEVKILKADPSKRTADIIREYLVGEVEKYVDYIFIGNSGVDAHAAIRKETGDTLGSVASEIIRHTKLNCMFVLKAIK